MSPSIWTRCAGTSEVRPWSGAAWRVVEAQHLVGVRGLVDDAAEHDLLEALIDRVKPPRPAGAATARLHHLLWTPFRYPPLRYGSRFGTRTERGIWYGSETLPTAFAEVAYYRLVFLEGTTAALGPLMTDLTAFRAALRTDRAVDLTAPPFAAHAADISAPDRYDAAQQLGRDMRTAGVALFRYRSARCREGGANVGVFEPEAFGSRRPAGLQAWTCVATRDGVELSARDFFERRHHRFPREQFLVAGALPAPAV